MSIKQRIRALEMQYKINMGREPWLTFDIVGKPTPEQQQAMDEADRQCRTYICFIEEGMTIYFSLQEESPPWLD